MNEHEGLSASVFIAAIWCGAVVASVAFWGGLTLLLGAERGEVNAASLFGAVVGIPGGFLIAISAFLVRFGIRGWRQAYETTRAAYQQPQPMGDGEAYPAAEDAKEVQENTYQCCEDRLTIDGYVIHGGPDCIHPQSDLYRDFY